MANVRTQTPTADLLVNQMKTGSLDAAIVYRANCSFVKDDLPIIGTFQQELNVTLKEGKPLRLAEVPDPEGGRVHLEIKAEVLD